MSSKMRAVFFSGFIVIAVQALHFANAASTNIFDPNPIKYPGPIQDITNRYGPNNVDTDVNVPVPDACKGKTFCLIKPKDYPQAHFNKMFKGYKALQPQPSLVLEDFGNRQGDPTETDGCSSVVSYEPLYHVKSNGDWRTVIQAPEENYVQKIRLEECNDTTSRCFTVYPELGIETHCKQTVARWEVLVAGGPNGTEHIQTDLPTCCSCVYVVKDKH